MLGVYTVTIKLIDDDKPASKSTSYNLLVVIKQPDDY